MNDITKFYKQVSDFKDKLVQILISLQKHGEVLKLEMYYNKLILFKQINVRRPIELFYEHGVSKYVDAISTRNDNFLLGKLQSIETKSIDESDMFFIAQIKEIWDYLNTRVQKNMWDYVQVICLLAERITDNSLLQTRIKSNKREKECVVY
jgi:hypothetical protein